MHPQSNLLPTFVLLAAFSTACSEDANAKKVRREIDDATGAIRTYTRQEIEQMTTKLQDRWTDLKADAAKLKAEAEVRGGEFKKRAEAVVADLEHRAAAAQKRLSDASGAAGEDASRAVDSAKESFEAAKEAVKNAWAELRK